jgi:hypothetical protein
VVLLFGRHPTAIRTQDRRPEDRRREEGASQEISCEKGAIEVSRHTPPASKPLG